MNCPNCGSPGVNAATEWHYGCGSVGDNERSPTALRSNPPFITVHSEPGRHYVAAACPTRGCGETITLTRVREVEA